MRNNCMTYGEYLACLMRWLLHRHPEGLESDLRAKIGQNGISSGVGRQDIKFLVCYLSEGRNLLLNTRNNSGDSPSLGTSSPTVWNGSKRSGNFSWVANSGLARMSVASPSQIGRMSLGDSYVTRHGRKSVTSNSWNWSRVATFAESHRRDIRASRVTREWLVSDIGSTCELWPITWLRHPAVYNLIEAMLGKLSVITSRSGVVHKSIMMVVPWSGVLRLKFYADRHTTNMRGLPPSHVSHKSLS